MFFRSPRFRLLLAGSTISRLGDVCFMVALPWIALALTGSPAALGTVLVAAAIPRATLMLVGGAVSDRISARTVMLATNAILTVCVAITALLAAQHALQLWMLYVVAVVFGTADAFGGPATRVLLPSIVCADDIAAANSMLQTSTQLCLLVGSAAAGLLIQRAGIVPALAFDASSFLALIAALVLIGAPGDVRVPSKSLVASIGEGLAYVARELWLRLLLIAVAAVNFCLTGTMQIGVITLVHARFGSAALFGVLMTVTAIGSLLGIALAGIVKLRGSLVRTLLGAGGLLGLLIASLALPLPVAAIAAVLCACGLVAGYVNVQAVSLLQRSVARDMLGRVSSLVTLCSIGVAPISLAICGAIAQINVSALFVVAGSALVSVGLTGLFSAALATAAGEPRTASRAADQIPATAPSLRGSEPPSSMPEG